jgi:phage head maturation protease
MRGAELKSEYARLLQLHRCRPIKREVLALLRATEGPVVIEGIASSPDVDAQRMSFAPNALTWSSPAHVPLLLRHDAGKVVGQTLDLHYDDSGRLHIKALVEHSTDMPALSIAASVVEAETISADSPSGWHFIIRKAVLDEISVTDKPSCSTALILSRRDVGAADITHDTVLASVARCRAALEQLRAAWSSNTESQVQPPEPNCASTRNLPESARASPASSPRPAAHIIGKLPRAMLAKNRNSWRDLIARLPVGGP